MVRIAILTASDKGAAGERKDASGDLIESRCREAGHDVSRRQILPDSRARIAELLRVWSDDAVAEVVITTGGTGLSVRDVTPEATLDVAEREVPGLMTALVTSGLRNTPYAALTRGIAALRGRTLIVNLPGSPKAVSEGLDVLLPLLPHIGDLLEGPVEQHPPGREP